MILIKKLCSILFFTFILLSAYTTKSKIVNLNGCWQTNENTNIEFVNGTSKIMYVNNGKNQKWHLYLKVEENYFENEIGSSYTFFNENNFVWQYGLNNNIKVYGFKNEKANALAIE